jgi:hypothetical protein
MPNIACNFSRALVLTCEDGSAYEALIYAVEVYVLQIYVATHARNLDSCKATANHAKTQDYRYAHIQAESNDVVTISSVRKLTAAARSNTCLPASYGLQTSSGQDQAAQALTMLFCPTISTPISTAVHTFCRYQAVAQRGRPSREKELLRPRQTPLHAALSGDDCYGGVVAAVRLEIPMAWRAREFFQMKARARVVHCLSYSHQGNKTNGDRHGRRQRQISHAE